MSQKQVYKKRGDALEETKGEERKGSYRGGRGGREPREDRPRTEGGDRKPHYMKRKEGATEDDQGDRKLQKKEHDKSSWVYKFHYEQRPQHNRFEVTLETPDPVIISKDQRKKNPEKNDFDKHMKDLDNQIESIRNKMFALQAKKKEALEGGRVQGS